MTGVQTCALPICASDVCTAVLAGIDTFKTVYPNKVFDYMACARPIILGIDGVARELVESAGAGIFVEPEQPEAFCDAVKVLRQDAGLREAMGKRGQEHVEQHFSRSILAEKYLDLLKDLAKKR